jgi:hypothetical protein
MFGFDLESDEFFTDKEFNKIMVSLTNYLEKLQKMDNVDEILQLKDDSLPNEILSYKRDSERFAGYNNKILTYEQQDAFQKKIQQVFHTIQLLKTKNETEGFRFFIERIPEDHIFHHNAERFALSIFKTDEISKYERKCLRKSKLNYFEMSETFQKLLSVYLTRNTELCEKANVPIGQITGIHTEYIISSMETNITLVVFNCDKFVLHSIATISLEKKEDNFLTIDSLCVNQIDKQKGGTILMSKIKQLAKNIGKQSIVLESVEGAVKFYMNEKFTRDDDITYDMSYNVSPKISKSSSSSSSSSSSHGRKSKKPRKSKSSSSSSRKKKKTSTTRKKSLSKKK